MTNKECYKLWAPFNKKWVDWVRPVPFININDNTKKYNPSNFMSYDFSFLENNENNIALIVDLPETKSIEVGIFLAKQYGIRPIPIHNGIIEQKGARATTDNTSIMSALLWGANELSQVEIKDDATPCFLIDINRLQRRKLDVSIFDNSYDVYHQDLPTEEYFIKNGISKIYILSENGLSKDLKRIFNEYPKKKVGIFLTNGYSEIKCIRKGK